MKALSYYILIGLFISLYSCNSSTQKDSVKKDENENVFKERENSAFLNDADFITMAFNWSLTEIELGNVAQKNALDKGVKNLGRLAVDDFSKMNETLTVLADNKNISLPSEIGRKSKKEIEEMSKRSGNIFDRAYTERMITSHSKEIRHFEDAANEASDFDIKSFASETLPTLRKHLAEAEALKLRIPYY
jgi:putative membrane protein